MILWIYLKKNGVISNEDAKTRKQQIKRNESMCQNNSKEIKSKIFSSLKQLNDIRNNRK